MSRNPNGIVRELASLLMRPSFANEPLSMQLLDRLCLADGSDKDLKAWSLTANRVFFC